ncbi:hypothetical protein LPJ61_003894, partial [Coemansia biformis]
HALWLFHQRRAHVYPAVGPGGKARHPRRLWRLPCPVLHGDDCGVYCRRHATQQVWKVSRNHHRRRRRHTAWKRLAHRLEHQWQSRQDRWISAHRWSWLWRLHPDNHAHQPGICHGQGHGCRNHHNHVLPLLWNGAVCVRSDQRRPERTPLQSRRHCGSISRPGTRTRGRAEGPVAPVLVGHTQPGRRHVYCGLFGRPASRVYRADRLHRPVLCPDIWLPAHRPQEGAEEDHRRL